MAPTAIDVADYLGRGGDDTVLSLAAEHLPTVTHMVKAYTRGKGFTVAGEPYDDLAAVIVSATARSVTNPEHNVSVDLGSFSMRPGVFNGWTLPELAILHRYRRRAQ